MTSFTHTLFTVFIILLFSFNVQISLQVYELGGNGLKYGALDKQIRANNKMTGVSSSKDDAGGVIFATYTSLSTTKQKTQRMRMEDIMDWLKNDPSGEQGVIAFDEIHKAKNLIPPNPQGRWAKSSTKVGKAVHNMQLKLPQCRILYSSATGMSRPKAIGK